MGKAQISSGSGLELAFRADLFGGTEENGWESVEGWLFRGMGGRVLLGFEEWVASVRNGYVRCAIFGKIFVN